MGPYDDGTGDNFDAENEPFHTPPSPNKMTNAPNIGKMTSLMDQKNK